ncbi:TetR/AcrR family transcriptional regulator [Paenibacillus oleatilyticus]|uniref:TetR/AcrR family transcriptional regulator n=1 Tax=Paenibacillus oleatilyticus TaxID=2594886 RepID=A0ABV4UW20_9BACL
MEEKWNEKKRYILFAAMKLFAANGYVQTTMQEIAEACKMSKGSVYQQFSSKEALLLDIFKFFFKRLNDGMQLVERERQLGPRERLERKILVCLGLWIEYPEFFTMQMRENGGFVNQEIRDYLKHMDTEISMFFIDSLVGIYGDGYAPYAPEGVLLLSSLLSTYMGLQLVEKITLGPDEVCRHILHIVDAVAERVLREKPRPLLNETNWPRLREVYARNAKSAHPLLLVKRCRERLERLPEGEARNEALESLAVLEQELVEIRPRKVIVLGMLANLKRSPELADLLAELEAACKQAGLVRG